MECTIQILFGVIGVKSIQYIVYENTNTHLK